MSPRIDVTAALQTRLQALDYYTGKLDGDGGPLTSLAVTDFKRTAGLDPRDFVGPITMSRLFATDAPRKKLPTLQNSQGQYPWIVEAKRHIGLKEGPGNKNNPILLDWANNLDISYPSDDIAWCGLFVAHCMKVGAPLDPQDFNRLGARAWGAYGRSSPAIFGAVVTFWRVSRNGWQGHVGILVGEDETAWQIIGGNQSDSVSLIRMAKDRALDFRFPKSVAPNPVFRLHNIVKGGFSQNEA
ncbi:MAG: TIGR02594 family protein [Blastocatellia bacterium]|nr:TIGR02594 family protein [Blastocatellia bacterium]